MANDQVIRFTGNLRRVEVSVPVITGRQPLQLCELEFIVSLDRIAILDFGPLHFREGGLEGEDVFGISRRGSVACECQHLLDVLRILFAKSLELGVRVEKVVITIRQSQAALAKVYDVLCRLAIILMNLRCVWGIDPIWFKCATNAGISFLSFNASIRASSASIGLLPEASTRDSSMKLL